MTADHLSYQRAASVSLAGFGFQVVFGLAMLLYAIFGEDSVAQSGAFAILIGALIWLALALVFHQHKLERLESMEGAAFRDSAAADASVFEDAGASGEQVQASRLAWMHKWFLPVVSLLIGAGYVLVGLLLYRRNAGAAAEAAEAGLLFQAPPESGWGIAIGVGVAVVGFVFARFVAGMAKQKVWALLNAGAAAAVAAALIGALLFVAHFLAEAVSADWLLRSGAVAINVLMMALGAEIGLNFLLTLYRPRKPGEYVRPAFDSRVMAFLAAPDRLAESISDAVNYQFGFNVSSTWFYRLVSRSMAMLLVLGALLLWGMTSFSVVNANEKALVLRGGELVRAVDSGIVWDRPWPLSRVVRYPADAITRITVGGAVVNTAEQEGEARLWTDPEPGEAQYVIVQASRAEDRDGAGGLRNLALMSAEIQLGYVVDDLERYILLAQDGPDSDPDRVRRDLLTAVASRVATMELSRFTVDEILGPERSRIADDLARAIQAEYDAIGAGVRLVFSGLQGVHPAPAAAGAFEAVVAADRKRIAAVERARAEAIRILASVAGDAGRARDIVEALDRLEALRDEGADEAALAEQRERVGDLIELAGGQAATLLAEAEGRRWERAMSERARAANVEGKNASYTAAPGPYRADLYFNALAAALNGGRVWITSDASVVLDQTELNADVGFQLDDLKALEETEE